MSFKAMGIEAVAAGIDGFEKNLGIMKEAISGVATEASRSESPIEGLFSALDVLALSAVAAGAAITSSIIGALIASTKEAAEAERVWVKLGAAIFAAGGEMADATPITLDIAKGLAMQFRDLAGGSDEAIASIIDMAVRMGTVSSNELPQFIQRVLDLAAATGVDAVAAARLMAQAEEDPISALTRFRRMGIQFTDAQEKQIKKLVQSGKVAEAYALVMERVGKATEGQAIAASKTFSGQLEILKNHILETSEEIGNRLLPLLTPLAEKMIELADYAGKRLIEMFDKFLLPILQKVFGIISKFLSGDYSGALADIIPQETIDKIVTFKKKAMDLIDEFIVPFIKDHGPTMTKVVIALGVAFATWKILNTIGTLVSLISTLTPLGAVLAIIGAAIALFSVAWDEDWGGMRTTLIDVWENSLKPELEELGVWLQQTLPVAIQILTDFWNTTLLPVIQTVIGWFDKANESTGSLANIYNAYLVPAIQFLSNLWTTVLYPALLLIYDWFTTVGIPFWQSIANLFGAVVGKALELFAGIWQNILYPILVIVADYIGDKLQPVFQALADLWTNIIGPALEKAANIILPALKTGFEGIKTVIQAVTKLINDLADAISGIDLGPLTPGSPTPFELGLRGVSKALKDVNREMNTSMMMSLSGTVSAPPTVGQGSYGRTQNITNEKNILEGAQITNNTPFDINALSEVVRAA